MEENQMTLTNDGTLTIEKGYTEEDLRKIWGGNLLRVMKQVQEAPLFSLKKRR